MDKNLRFLNEEGLTADFEFQRVPLDNNGRTKPMKTRKTFCRLYDTKAYEAWRKSCIDPQSKSHKPAILALAYAKCDLKHDNFSKHYGRDRALGKAIKNYITKSIN